MTLAAARVLLLLCLLGAAESVSETKNATKTYIISMAKWLKPPKFSTHRHWYAHTVGSDTKIVYHYDSAFHGFAARLTAGQARRLRRTLGVLSVTPDKIYSLHTTRTPEFLGLSAENGLWPDSNFGDDLIVGVLDTGAWPESPSFADNGLGSPPARWKGTCDGGDGFTCNNKLIGARYYYQGYSLGHMADSALSARDTEGHGTHTASTIAGAAVAGANLLGYAGGTARGMAIRARVAIYKVCWSQGCYCSDILAALDDCVSDGVDGISMSLGGSVSPYYDDCVASGAFGAVQKGIFVSCSAGNSGPGLATASNVAPWLITVGASTLDRDFPAYAVLGDGTEHRGVSLSNDSLPKADNIPLIYAGNASRDGARNANLCLKNTLDPSLVAGKIVLCDRGTNARVAKGEVVKDASGLGMILANAAENGNELTADTHVLPATSVGYEAGLAIKKYILSSTAPVGTIDFRGTQIGVKPAPVMAAFSSRGPNVITPEILKPDLTAPGVNILAAWSGAVGPSSLASDPRRVVFNIISGTSMSCPHVSGVAALLRASRPGWSPAAIRSAMMSTATWLDNEGVAITDSATGKSSTPFDLGAGHVAPQRALDPGLVYDITPEDYLLFLCGEGYTPTQISVFAKRNYTCPSDAPTARDLNYPSFAVVFPPAEKTVRYSRRLTSVAPSGSTYTAEISISDENVAAEVLPSTLRFAGDGDERSFDVIFTAKKRGNGPVYGALTWTDGHHRVRSPVTVSWTDSFSPRMPVSEAIDSRWIGTS